MSRRTRAAVAAAALAALLGLLEIVGRWYAARPLPGPPVEVSPWIRALDAGHRPALR